MNLESGVTIPTTTIYLDMAGLIGGAVTGAVSAPCLIYIYRKYNDQMNIVWKWIPRAAPQSITRSVMFVCILYSLFNLLSIIPPLVSNALELEQPIIRWCELGSEFLQFMGATNLANAFIGIGQLFLENKRFLKKENIASFGIMRKNMLVMAVGASLGAIFVSAEYYFDLLSFSPLKLTGSVLSIFGAILTIFFACNVGAIGNKAYPVRLFGLVIVICFVVVVLEVIKIFCTFHLIPKEMSYTSAVPLLSLVIIGYGQISYKPPPPPPKFVVQPRGNPKVLGLAPVRGSKPYSTLVGDPCKVSTVPVRHPATNLIMVLPHGENILAPFKGVHHPKTANSGPAPIE